MKYAWIDTQRAHYALSEMCPVLDVSIGGYRAWKRGGKPERKHLTDAQMLALIRAIHAEFKGAYGSPAWCWNCAPGDSPRARNASSG